MRELDGKARLTIVGVKRFSRNAGMDGIEHRAPTLTYVVDKLELSELGVECALLH